MQKYFVTFLKCILKKLIYYYFSFRTKVILSFKIIHFRLFLFQTYIYLYMLQKKLFYKKKSNFLECGESIEVIFLKSSLTCESSTISHLTPQDTFRVFSLKINMYCIYIYSFNYQMLGNPMQDFSLYMPKL